MGRGVERLRRDWNELAEEDALSAVLAQLGGQARPWQLDEFLATGEEEIAGMLATAERLRLPARRRRALDFGCGVGRLTRALSLRFERCVGVDVSDEMVRRAEELNRDRPGCVFVANVAPDLRRFRDGEFDFVYSSKVLQHMTSASLACRYVAEFVRLLERDGLAVFQLWTRIPWRNRLQPRRRFYGVLRTLGAPQALLARLGLSPKGRGIFVSEETIRGVVDAAGGRVVHTEADGEWGLVYYVARAERATPTRSSPGASS